MKNNKTLFVFTLDHCVDIITNSSSELFVLEGQNIEILKETVNGLYEEFLNENENNLDLNRNGYIRDRYPSYLTQYNEIKALKDCDNEDIDTYISYAYCTYSNKKIIDGFTFEEMYEIPKYLLKLKKDKKDTTPFKPSDYWLKDNFVENNRERIIKSLDPKGTMFMLFSSEENPVYEFQEKLECIATRYHLG